MPDPIAPPPPSVEIDGDSFSAALSASAPQMGLPAGAAPPAEVKPDVATPPPAEAKPEEKPADTKPKKGLDALPEEEAKEKAKEDEKPKADAEEPEVDTSKWGKPQQEAFAAMRGEKKRLKEQVKDAQMQVEKLRKDLEQVKASPKDSEATLKKLTELETWKSAQELERTPEWENAVTKPLQKSLDMLDRIAKHGKVDSAALLKATDEEVDFERILAIRKVFDAAEEPVPSEIVNAAIREAEKLHPIYEKGNELKRKAGETLNSIHHQTAQQKEAAAKAEEAEYSKHHDHIYEQMAKKMPSVFSKAEIADAVKAARPATDPAEKAFQAQAAELLPTIFAELLAARKEAAAEKASKLALLGTRPGVNPPTVPAAKPANSDDVELDEEGFDAALKKRG